MLLVVLDWSCQSRRFNIFAGGEDRRGLAKIALHPCAARRLHLTGGARASQLGDSTGASLIDRCYTVTVQDRHMEMVVYLVSVSAQRTTVIEEDTVSRDVLENIYLHPALVRLSNPNPQSQTASPETLEWSSWSSGADCRCSCLSASFSIVLLVRSCSQTLVTLISIPE